VELVGSDTLEDYLISLLILKPDLVLRTSAEQSSPNQFYSEKVKTFLEIFKNYLIVGQSIKVLDYLTQIVLPAKADRMYLEKSYLQAQERWPDWLEAKNDLQNEFEFILHQLQKRNINSKLAELEMAIKQAEKRKDKKLVVSLAGEFQNTAQFLGKI